MNRQERFRACDCTPYACCGISFFTTTVNTLHFSGPIKSSKTIYIRFLKNYGYSHIMYPIRLSSRMPDMNGIQGDLAIRKASCAGMDRSGESIHTPLKDIFPVHPVPGDLGQFQRIQKSRLIPVRQIQIK